MHNFPVIPRRKISSVGVKVDTLDFGCGPMGYLYQSMQRLSLDKIGTLCMRHIDRDIKGADNDVRFPIAMQSGYKAIDYGDCVYFLLAVRNSLLEQHLLQTFLPKCQAKICSIIIGGLYNIGISASGANAKNTAYYNHALAPPQLTPINPSEVWQHLNATGLLNKVAPVALHQKSKVIPHAYR
tara:strand:- start:15815 stop:16363 length:549 start_codon:yes stop_codon:yes gene_type:complete